MSTPVSDLPAARTPVPNADPNSDINPLPDSLGVVDDFSAPCDCPKCGNPLVDPAGLGWCSKCGYCKSLANEQKLLETSSRPTLGGVEVGGVISSLPLWFWASGLILAIGIAISVFADKRLPVGDEFDRALWATLQIAIGVFIIFLAQCWALMSIAPDDPKLTFKDAIAPFRLWMLVGKRLPRLKGSLWAAVFGLSLIVGAAAFIGGFAHWFEYLPKNAAEQSLRKRSSENPPLIVPVD